MRLDSNVIRSSKEVEDVLEQEHPHSGTVAVQNNVNARRRTDTSSNRHNTKPSCQDQDCGLSSRNNCNGPQKKNQNKEILATADDEKDIRKVAEMAMCVRSGDCEAGLCCVRYLTGKRCQRIPKKGDVCLLQEHSKLRRNLERCNCAQGLTCRAQATSPKGQGICEPRSRKNMRTARHSGKRRVAERICG
ncbi:dickkopf-related protein 4-like isoform X2 [Esox lucius]|uniref:dickkopf-related protein 4-like isoform X2 n=1 Tax=Esox lucius TaxID=8010 RepID=UPI00057763E0|nr:dickkopf-related protein 4-like isoform X2 [Esox lucius]